MLDATHARCSACKETKPRDAFQRNRSAKSGLQANCKLCMKALNARWYAEHKAERAVTVAAYEAAHPGLRAKCTRNYRERHPEKVAADVVRYREENRELLNKKRLAYYHRNQPREREKFKVWYLANHALALAIHKRWRQNNPAKMRAQEAMRRRRLAASKCKLTETQWRETLAIFNHRCAYCGSGAKLTMDHMDPISRGGEHSQDNVVPSCLPCNLHKATKGVAHMVNRPWIGASLGT